MDTKVYTSVSEEETCHLGMELAVLLKPGDTIALYGDLGSGKTEFVKGVCSGLKVEDLVSSPTFTIVNEYSGLTSDGEVVRVYHIDLYRLESPKELNEIGLSETLSDDTAIKLVEWSEHAGDVLPHEHFEVHISQLQSQEDGRQIQVVQPEAEASDS